MKPFEKGREMGEVVWNSWVDNGLSEVCGD